MKGKGTGVIGKIREDPRISGNSLNCNAVIQTAQNDLKSIWSYLQNITQSQIERKIIQVKKYLRILSLCFLTMLSFSFFVLFLLLCILMYLVMLWAQISINFLFYQVIHLSMLAPYLLTFRKWKQEESFCWTPNVGF